MPPIDVNQFLDTANREENARRESGLPPSPRPQASGSPSVTSRNGQPLITGDFNQTMQNFVDAARETANTRRENHVQDMNMQTLLQLAQVLGGGHSGGVGGSYGGSGGSSAAGSRSAGSFGTVSSGNPAFDLYQKNLNSLLEMHTKNGIGVLDYNEAHKNALSITQRQLKDFSPADPNSIESTTSRGGFAGAQQQSNWRDDAQKAIVSAVLGRMGGDMQTSLAPLVQSLQTPSGQNAKSLVNLQSALPSSGMTVTPPAISPSFAQAGVTPPAPAPLPSAPSLGRSILNGAAGTAFRSGALGPLSGLFPDAQGALGSATVSAIGNGNKTAGDMLGTGIAKGAMAVKNFFTNDQPAAADPLRGIN